MENLERSGSDVKLKVAELAERYGETQRELTRLRDGAEERQAEIVALTEEKDQHLAALSLCEAARDELAAALKLAEERAPTQIAAHETSVRELGVQLARKDEEFTEQLARLRAEVDAAHSRLRAEEDSAGNLDNYKKRAQLALKKVSRPYVFAVLFLHRLIVLLHYSQANTTNATLTAEVQQLQASLEEVSTRLAEALENNSALTNTLTEMKLSSESIRYTKMVHYRHVVVLMYLSVWCSGRRERCWKTLWPTHRRSVLKRNRSEALFIVICGCVSTMLNDDIFFLLVIRQVRRKKAR